MYNYTYKYIHFLFSKFIINCKSNSQYVRIILKKKPFVTKNIIVMKKEIEHNWFGTEGTRKHCFEMQLTINYTTSRCYRCFTFCCFFICGGGGILVHF